MRACWDRGQADTLGGDLDRLAKRRGEHAQVGRAGPRAVGGDLQVEVCPGQPGPRVLVDVQRAAGFRGEVVFQGRGQTHDVRRAAGAVEPDAAPAGVVLLDV